MLHERRFRALGTEVGVWVWSTAPELDPILDALPAAFEEAEQELSRFRADSGLCKLNARAGKGPQRVSAALAEVCGLALDAAGATGGLFDPTILHALEAAGYDAPFAEVVAAGRKARPVPPPPPGPHWSEIQRDGLTIALPAGMALDLGGIAKGWLVDRVAEALRPFGPALVDAGGDVRATGKAAGLPWPVAVADPRPGGRDLAQVELGDEAVATSSVARRRWLHGEEWAHHIIDPRTRRPAATDVLSVTVLGETAAACEVQAKLALLLGGDAGAAHLEARGLAALLVLADGSVRTVSERFGPAP
ncbi:MAG: FAD:protein FMN transferase [Candidatus Sericytochromatia bacterium]|nr:FAD:protein FMN transferase [Candidatus Tanganyikabacteria bacterium]